jgi:PKD repeat protein
MLPSTRRLLSIGWLMLLCTAVHAADLSVANYVLQSSRRVSATDFELVYKADVANTGPALRSVIGSLTSTSAATVVVEGTLSFGDVGSGATRTSTDTFTIRQNRTVPFNPSALAWTVSGTPATPIAADFVYAPAGGNAPVDVRFTPVPVTNVAIDRYEWDLDGNGSFEITDTVGRNQTRRFTVPGSYAVALRVTDSEGRTDSTTKTIVVGNAPPAVTASAAPSNGQVPLNVSFTVTATDNEGVASFDWDFDGDGTYDRTITGTSGNTTFSYTTPGTYGPRVRVTDRMGASAVVFVPTMEVRAAPTGSPRVTLSVNRASGAAPLQVRLGASVSDPQAKAVLRYEWDVDGDGTYDNTTTLASFDTLFATAGTYYPRVRATMADGRTAEDAERVVVTSTQTLALNTDTLDVQLAQTVEVTTVLSAASRVSLVVERREGGVVRTLLPYTDRPAGTYLDTWDGRRDDGQYAADGIYHVVLLYLVNGTPQRLDLSTTTGGSEYNPARTSIPATFEPYNGKPLAVDFTLTRASEVTAFIGSFNVNTRYVTFFTRKPFGRGTHRIVWNGDNAEGQIIKPAPGDSFLFGIFGYTLPSNGVLVRNGVQLSGLASSPPIFDPTGYDSTGTRRNTCSVQFTLSLPAAVELAVQDAASGQVVARVQYPGLGAGVRTIAWDGKVDGGRYAAPGTYRLGLTAIHANGLRSMTSYVLQRIYY